MVHVACCWAAVLAQCSLFYSHSETKKISLCSAAAACGVGVAFGAPLGGVLFSLEEVSSYFPPRTMVTAFLASMAGAFTLACWDPTQTGRITNFVPLSMGSAHYEFWEMSRKTALLRGARML